MLDMCVRFIARRHHMLTDKHVRILDEVWDLYEPPLPPLPPSPPPERHHVHFYEAERPQQQQAPQQPPQQPEWPCDRCIDDEVWECVPTYLRRVPQQEQQRQQERQQEIDALWRQVPQGEPVSASTCEETCDCETCEWQDRRRAEEEYQEGEQSRQNWQERYEQVGGERAPCCSDYLRSCDADRCTYECGAACASSAPAPEQESTIDLTCDKESCAYGCDYNHPPPASSYPPPPIESCLYGCSFSCGVKEGEDCRAEFDAEGNQLPPVVRSAVDTVIESDDDDMPALVPFAAEPRPRGWYNPEEETEIVQAPQPRSPKAKPLFPYNHPHWPSPRAKALVQWMIRSGQTSKTAMSSALKEPVTSLTHDVCMRFLAKYYKLSHEKLLETNIYVLHNPDSHTPYWQRCTCLFCKDGYRYMW
jgi:hypothetical protein